ncbi:putative RNA methyltransferase [Reinekea sp. G2M2-21]|uniref:putative RNA methyltransferase n=1 Tax=Reinekea sp. G2M2-21 TaxID=2788942 RepID=UPI0018A9C59A|nr:methyltransferase domain-containing protein [Reinekea sp. G2M2-21]
MTTPCYACPVCQQPLTLNQKSWRCSQNHSFDEHKKGYINLLLAQNKRSKAPGDDPEMVIRRRRFLEAGFYQPLAETIASRLQASLPTSSQIWDAGCGEGYYTALCQRQNPTATFYGLDISKPAIAAACQHKGIYWCVASSSRPPYLEHSFDAIISIFSRVDADAFHRVLKPGGIIGMATPDQDHLMALRENIYDSVRPYDTQKHQQYFDDRFTLIDDHRLEIDLNLSTNQAILDLLGMTPHAHRLPNSTREKLAQLPSLQDKACFKIYWLQKQAE